MKTDHYSILHPRVAGNPALREAQIEAFASIAGHDFTTPQGREVSIVLPVGCGKSGCWR